MDLNVSNRLKNERVRLNLTQKEVADSTNMSTKSIARWEAGIPIPSDKLVILASLGFDVDYILTGQHKLMPFGSALGDFEVGGAIKQLTQQQGISLEEQKILEQYRLLNDDGKFAIASMLKALLA